MALRDIGVRAVVANIGPFQRDMGRYSSSIERAEKRTQAFGEKATRTGVALAAMGGIIVALGAISLRTFGQFEQSMARVGAVTQASEQELATLTETAKEMGRTTVFSARQSASALSFLALAGLSVNEQMGALPSVLQLAAAGQLDLATSADIVTNVMAGFGLTVEELGRANDVLVTGFTSANTNLVQLGQAFKFAGPIAKAAGITFEETAAALALMGNAGIQASMAGTGLRGAITRLLRPSGEAKRVIAALGLTVTDAADKMLPLTEIIGQLEDVGLSAGDAMTLFGQRAGPAMLALVEQGSGALSDLSEQMLVSGGIAERIAEQQLDTLSGSMTLLKSQVEGVTIAIGQGLAPVLRDLARALNPVIEGVTAFAEQQPGLARLVFAAAVAVLALGLTLAAIGFILPAIITGVGLLATGLGIATVAIVAFLLAAGPVTILLLVLAGAVLLAISAWGLWGNVIQSVAFALENIFALLKAIVTLDFGSVAGFFGGLPGSLPGFAHGGVSRGGLATVGERGPEVVNLPAGATVTPVSRSTSFNVEAHYTTPQNPASIRLDLETLAMMAGR